MQLRPSKLSWIAKILLQFSFLTEVSSFTTRPQESYFNIQTSVSDPYSFDTDPDPIRTQGFDDQK